MDVYTMIAERIITELERGVVPWHKPWTTTSPAISHTTGKPYSLLNQLLLGGRSGEYLTFQQAGKEGGHVRKGEKSSIVVFFKFIEQCCLHRPLAVRAARGQAFYRQRGRQGRQGCAVDPG